MEEFESPDLKMPGRSTEAENGVIIDIKEEFHEVATDDISYEHIPETYQPAMRCRLCAIPNENMVDIFVCNKIDENIINKIKYCLRIVVKESDNLPKQVCRSCLQELELCYQFNKFVEEAERKLLAFDKQTSTKFEGTETNIRTSTTFYTHSGATVHQNMQSIDSESSTNAQKEQSRRLPVAVGLGSASFSNERRISSHIERHRLLSVDSSTKILQQNTCNAPASETTCSKFQADDQMPSNCSQYQNKSRLEAVSIKQEEPVVPEGSQTNRIWSGCESTDLKTEVNMIQESCHQPSENTFNAPSDLEQNTMNSEQANFLCMLCKKSFRYLSMMKMHMTTHSDKRSWECDHCKKSFKRKIHLQTHMRVCKNRTYNCNFCTALFATEVGLFRHERLHTEDRPYDCDYCGKKYTTRKQRDDHHRIHTGERPFKCSLCEKTFSWSSSLKLHAAVHSNEKKFACSLCNKSYKSFNARKLHMAAVHVDAKP